MPASYTEMSCFITGCAHSPYLNPNVRTVFVNSVTSLLHSPECVLSTNLLASVSDDTMVWIQSLNNRRKVYVSWIQGVRLCVIHRFEAFTDHWPTIFWNCLR